MMLDDILATRIDNPALGPAVDEVQDHGEVVINIVKKLVEFNGLDQ